MHESADSERFTREAWLLGVPLTPALSRGERDLKAYSGAAVRDVGTVGENFLVRRTWTEA